MSEMRWKLAILWVLRLTTLAVIMVPAWWLSIIWPEQAFYIAWGGAMTFYGVPTFIFDGVEKSIRDDYKLAGKP